VSTASVWCGASESSVRITPGIDFYNYPHAGSTQRGSAVRRAAPGAQPTAAASVETRFAAAAAFLGGPIPTTDIRAPRNPLVHVLQKVTLH
jgi:hypothetical protein